MAKYETNGQMTYVDENGNEHLLFPNTKIDRVEGLPEELAAKAPSGFGYGEVPVSLGTADNEETFVANLTEQFNKTVSRTRKVRFTWGGGAWTGELWNAGNNYGVLTAYSYAVQNVGFVVQKVIRNCVDGEWQPWEYENPPMRSGVEYRTTERYLGKPVYAKVITGKALAVADTTVSISLGVGSGVITNLVDFIITHHGASTSVYTFPQSNIHPNTNIRKFFEFP